MCGIIGHFHTGINKTPVNDDVLLQFEDQKERGINGFGIVKINDKMEYRVDRATEGYKFMYDIHQDPVRGMIVHHRIPTSSDNKIKQTHPIAVEHSSLKHKYLVVHNGVIRNDQELKLEHEELGFVYTTLDQSGTIEKFNDSETVAIELARFIEGQTNKVGTTGNAALICLQISKKTNKVEKLFFGRNDGNPLNMAKTRNKLMLSSTGPGDEVKPFTLYECKLDADMKLKKRQMGFKVEPAYVPTQSLIPLVSKPDKDLTALERYWKAKQEREDEEDWNTSFGKKIYNESEDDPVDLSDAEELVLAAIEEGRETIGDYVDNFVNFLYDPTAISNMNENDIELLTTSIRLELEDMLKKSNEIHTEIALSRESEERSEVGFHQ